MARIVTTQYRYKRPPRKTQKATALEVPAIRKVSATDHPSGAQGGDTPTRPAIVTARAPRREKVGDAPDLTSEEHQRRGDAADALFRELVRRATARSSAD